MSESGFRIMEALSGVDESLLERSENTGKCKKTKMQKYRMRYYCGACAACLCLCLLGAAYWKIQITSKGGFPGADGAQTSEKSMYDEGKVELCEEAGADETNLEEEMYDAVTEDCIVSGHGSGSAPESAKAGMKQMATILEQNWSEVAPKELLSGFEYSYVDDGQDGAPEAIICSWNHEEQYFNVTVMDAAYFGTVHVPELKIESASGTECEKNLLILDAKEDWTKEIPDVDDSGIVRFGLKLGEDIMVLYEGTLDRTTICSLLETLDET